MLILKKTQGAEFNLMQLAKLYKLFKHLKQLV